MRKPGLQYLQDVFFPPSSQERDENPGQHNLQGVFCPSLSQDSDEKAWPSGCILSSFLSGEGRKTLATYGVCSVLLPPRRALRKPGLQYWQGVFFPPSS
jgi:hypothetical protein